MKKLFSSLAIAALIGGAALTIPQSADAWGGPGYNGYGPGHGYSYGGLNGPGYPSYPYYFSNGPSGQYHGHPYWNGNNYRGPIYGPWSRYTRPYFTPRGAGPWNYYAGPYRFNGNGAPAPQAPVK